MAKNQQERIFNESEDSPLALAADKLFECLEELDKVKEEKEEAERELIELMNKNMKYSFYHKRRKIELKNSEIKQKIKIKEEKGVA